jgi:predicted aldo/keto reductase-like oxidoreductase
MTILVFVGKLAPKTLEGDIETIRLGKTEMMVSQVGLGGIPIQRVSEDEAIAVVKRCLDLGINFIDTANGYGNSEERIGKAISGCRNKVILATKSVPRTAAQVETNLKQSLKRLQVESIDLYQFHNISDSDTLNKVLAYDGSMAMLEEAKKAGLVKHIGVSSHSMDTAKELVKSGRFETIMFPFNFITREAIDELLPLAREHDVGFIAMKPLAGGMLDNVALAFKYLSQFPDVISIPGIENSREIEQIVQILEDPLVITEVEQREIGRLREELDSEFCRRCGYCQPCTEEIQISLVMTIPTFAKRMPLDKVFAGRLVTQMEKAINCSKCGECEGRCPYGLPIVEMIEKHTNWYYTGKKEFEKETSSGESV